MPFSDLLGQEYAIDILRRSWSSGRRPSFLLFTGLPGTGRGFAAQLYSQALLCEEPSKDIGGCGGCDSCVQVIKRKHPAFIIVDREYQDKMLGKDVPKEELGIDIFRLAVSHLRHRPMGRGGSVGVVEEAEEMSAEAQVSLLKILEESPAHLTWIWIAPGEDAVLGTVWSRAQLKVRFKPLEPLAMARILEKAEKLAPAQAARVAEISAGSLKRARRIIQRMSSGEPSGAFRPLNPAQALTLSLKVARFKIFKYAREDVGRVLDDYELMALEAMRGESNPAPWRLLNAVFYSRRMLDENVTPSLVLEHFLLSQCSNVS